MQRRGVPFFSAQSRLFADGNDGFLTPWARRGRIQVLYRTVSQRASVVALPRYCCSRSLLLLFLLDGRKRGVRTEPKISILRLIASLFVDTPLLHNRSMRSTLDGVGGRKIRNVAHGAHARGLRRQITGIGSLPAELRCLYPDVRTSSAALEHLCTNTSFSGQVGGRVSCVSDVEGVVSTSGIYPDPYENVHSPPGKVLFRRASCSPAPPWYMPPVKKSSCAGCNRQ